MEAVDWDKEYWDCVLHSKIQCIIYKVFLLKLATAVATQLNSIG